MKPVPRWQANRNVLVSFGCHGRMVPLHDFCLIMPGMSLHPFMLFFASIVPVTPGGTSGMPAADPAALSASAFTMLRRTLAAEQNWVGIHAAEVLVALGEAEAIRQDFIGGLGRTESSPYRTGVWRVLARTARTPEERGGWIARIEAVLSDPAASDQSAAVECLAKLGHPLTGPGLSMVRRQAGSPPESETLVPLWALHLAGDREALPAIVRALRSDDLVARRRAGYVLRWLQIREPAVLAALARAADAEPAGTDTHAYLLSAALQLDAAPGRAAAWQVGLEKILQQGSVSARFEAAHALASCFPTARLSSLADMLGDPEGDVRIGAALVILSVLRQQRGA